MITREERAKKFISSANNALDGSPYSFPDDESSFQRILEIDQTLQNIQDKLGNLKEVSNLPRALKNSLRAREIYESNAIEGLGLDLSRTAQLVESTKNSMPDDKEYIEWAVTQGIKNDTHTYDVIGLAAARLLSKWISDSVDRPVTESDIRAIHEIIMKNQMYAGKYKDLPNEIGSQAHKPTSPEDTPNQMRVFSEWMNHLPRRGFQSSESIVKAAAVHAWLTHIHPFYDGNGRLARLLANLVLARENMPPLILKNTSHRARYLDALAFSDSGGDLSRLVLLFCRAIERVIDDMQDPILAQEMFEADINLRLSDDFKIWKKALQDFVGEISVVFPFYRLNFELVGELSPSEYRNLRNGKKPHNSWFMKIYDENGEDVALLFFGFIPGWVKSKIEQDEIYPCIFVAARDNNPKSLRPFKSLEKEDMKNGYSKFVIEPLIKSVICWGEHQASFGKFSFQKAADHLAQFCLELRNNPI